MADTCICRTDSDGRRWTNAGCKTHGAHSAAEEENSREHLDKLLGRTW